MPVPFIVSDSNSFKAVKRNSDNPLTKYVCDYVINEWHDYDDKVNIFKDVLYMGCQSGVVGALIWYSQTTAFYKKYREQISETIPDETERKAFIAENKDRKKRNISKRYSLLWRKVRLQQWNWFISLRVTYLSLLLRAKVTLTYGYSRTLPKNVKP